MVASLNEADYHHSRGVSSFSIMWYIKQYHDEFGDVTDNKYIFNRVFGRFSNSATTSSHLSVDIMIASTSQIKFMLYEYKYLQSLVTEYSPTNYILKIRTAISDEVLQGQNWSNRVVLASQSAQILHNHLMKNREVKVAVRRDVSYDDLSQYSFNIPNNCLYKEAFKQLEN